jgi:hypothetical protein
VYNLFVAVLSLIFATAIMGYRTGPRGVASVYLRRLSGGLHVVNRKSDGPGPRLTGDIARRVHISPVPYGARGMRPFVGGS